MMAEAALDQTLGTLLRMHEEAFRQLGGVPEEILYDRMKTVWLKTDERGEIVWHPVFLDFARYWGFRPRLCRPYRAQTKGKIESGVKYVRRNFLCGLQGREPGSLTDFNAQLRQWGLESLESTRSWNNARTGRSTIEGRTTATAAHCRPTPISVRRRRVAEGRARCVCLMGKQSVLGAMDLCRCIGMGS